jgi:hypothetical protein
VSGESLDMLWVEAVTESMADNVIGHHATMPRVGETAQTVCATRCLKDRLHGSMMTMVPHPDAIRTSCRRVPSRRATD